MILLLPVFLIAFIIIIYGLINDSDYVRIKCPVCGTKDITSKTSVKSMIYNHYCENQGKWANIRFNGFKDPNRQCSQDLTGLFYSHPFVVKSLKEASEFKSMSDTALEWTETLDNERRNWDIKAKEN